MDAKPEDPPMLTPYDKGKRCRYYAQGEIGCWISCLLLSDRFLRILQERRRLLVLAYNRRQATRGFTRFARGR